MFKFEIMTKFEIFNKIYWNGTEKTFFGHRVSKRSLNEKFHDKEFVDEAIAKLFVECPSKFPGESKHEKHYLLKTFWSIIDNYRTTIEACKSNNNMKWIYIKDFILNTIFCMSDYRWYMHPTILKRNGRFFINPNINF